MHLAYMRSPLFCNETFCDGVSLVGKCGKACASCKFCIERWPISRWIMLYDPLLQYHNNRHEIIIVTDTTTIPHWRSEKRVSSMDETTGHAFLFLWSLTAAGATLTLNCACALAKIKLPNEVGCEPGSWTRLRLTEPAGADHLSDIHKRTERATNRV